MPDAVELVARLEQAAMKLDDLAANGNHHDDWEEPRLKGKAEGVRLALSYVREMLLIDGYRDHSEAETTNND